MIPKSEVMIMVKKIGDLSDAHFQGRDKLSPFPEHPNPDVIGPMKSRLFDTPEKIEAFFEDAKRPGGYIHILGSGDDDKALSGRR